MSPAGRMYTETRRLDAEGRREVLCRCSLCGRVSWYLAQHLIPSESRWGYTFPEHDSECAQWGNAHPLPPEGGVA